MEMLGILAKADDFVVGLLIGGAIGFLAGPVLRSAIVARERAAARREARLTEQLIERLESMDVDDLIGGGGDEGSELAPPSDPGDDRSGDSVRWRTSR